MKRNLQEDLKLLGIAFFEHIQLDTNCEFGSIGLDCKRPFGNSSVEYDILKIIGWDIGDEDEGREPQVYTDEKGNVLDGDEYARDLYYKYLLPYIVSIGAKHFNVNIKDTLTRRFKDNFFQNGGWQQ